MGQRPMAVLNLLKIALESIIKVSKTTKKTENVTTLETQFETIEKELTQRHPISYTEEGDIDDIQEQIDMVLGEDEEDEFSPT